MEKITMFCDLQFSQLGFRNLSSESEEAGLIVPSGPFQFYGLFHKIPFGAIVSDTSCQQASSHSLKNQDIYTLKTGKISWPTFFLFMCLSFTICTNNRNTENPAVLYFVFAFKEIDKYGGSKDGEDQQEYCLGRSTGITQHSGWQTHWSEEPNINSTTIEISFESQIFKT
ncbi:unnamed protein product [Pipistrellus nathusii]|uniref:Uncharacterized protein n=1 Tax=Pipistrellus nathusii TaxID=59473 RepID=A0ABN9Z529_PIPNA